MTTKAYLKDKKYAIITLLLSIMFLVFFLSVLRVQFEIQVVVYGIVLVVGLVPLVVEYLRRYSYYNGLMDNLEALDKKYLISELMDVPYFLDGIIISEALAQTSKSMADTVRMYKSRQDEYMDYLELWIHEVKTPLSAMGLIAANTNNEKMKDIMEEAKKVEDYLEQALFYARSTTVEKDSILQDTNLKLVVGNAVKDLSNIFISKGVRLVLDMEDTMVVSDSKWLEFMIKQILSNSLKYVDAKTGLITIETQQLEQRVVLLIRDNGPGITSQDIGRVFERGFTGKHGRLHKQATGMGLYLVKTLGDKLHLSIAIESQDGTQVMIGFPKSNMMLR